MECELCGEYIKLYPEMNVGLFEPHEVVMERRIAEVARAVFEHVMRHLKEMQESQKGRERL